ncbi:hypothetical protein DFJ43DRAFT_1080128 [Lentinula guzmanii]|uniref:Association with the SNF1 complex (ASC) domain-containing protein n=1 Tax=Lentinula guzmanii TaxID=2804957 RepID=A0AA38MYM3_9AGAR|nr:hypothetical protein DFJ43DRAFT_1080128 [Lentinula guzmanii]
MGNTQSQQPTNSPTGSKRFGSPRPRTSSVASTGTGTPPKRSTSLKTGRGRGSRLGQGQAHTRHQSQSPSPSPSVLGQPGRVRSPIPGSRLGAREREVRDAWERETREREKAKEKEKEKEKEQKRAIPTKKKSLELPDLTLTSAVAIPRPTSMIRVESPERQDEQVPHSQILVRSSIAFPLANSIPANRVNPQPRQGEPTYLVKISWHGGGQEVYLTRAGDDDWNGKTEMSREDSTFSTIIALPRGTHHLRFIVDGETRVADDLPTAVADNGSLANYVAVGLGEGDSPTTDEVQRPDTLTRFHSAFWSEEGPLLSNEVWSTEIPLELVEAALEEESYLAYQNDLENAQANGSPSTSVTGSPKSRTASPVPVVGIGALGERSGRERTSPLRREGRDERTSREGRKREREWKSMSLVIAQRSTDRPLPITTASGTDVSQSPPTSSIPHSPEPSYYGTYNSANALAIQNPQINSADIANAIPALADDTSVLPVPSHVVLHHLCTSAMRNGVLAVGETTRYRKKFVTTIYYKPTS